MLTTERKARGKKGNGIKVAGAQLLEPRLRIEVSLFSLIFFFSVPSQRFLSRAFIAASLLPFRARRYLSFLSFDFNEIRGMTRKKEKKCESERARLAWKGMENGWKSIVETWPSARGLKRQRNCGLTARNVDAVGQVCARRGRRNCECS